MHRAIDSFSPRLVVVDPLSTFDTITDPRGVGSLITRLIDLARGRGITTVFVHLSTGGAPVDTTDGKISSVADVWILLRDLESNGERNRALYLLKARGMAHSNQVREFRMGSTGITLIPVYIDGDAVRIGSARVAHEARDRLERLAHQHELERAHAELELEQARHRASLAEHELALIAAQRKVDRLRDEASAAEAERVSVLHSRSHGEQPAVHDTGPDDAEGGSGS
jgi:circadian clock protein KaiC